MTRRLKILFHAHCFDGAASAGLFSRFYAERIDAEAEIVFSGKVHARGPVFDDRDFDADDHAVVDFRYSADPRLGWWFDHHLSAFQQPGDEASFRTRPHERFFYDPAARSCTKFLAGQLTRVHGWDPSAHADLIAWADIIDGAQFESAQQAVALAEPALQVMTFLEHNQDPALAIEIIHQLTSRPLVDVAAQPALRAALAPILAHNAHAEQILRARVRSAGGIATLDVGDDGIDGYNKFLPYLLAPEARYVVAVSASPARTKVSVGMNPWNRPEPLTNIAHICERYGGGGHAVVGAITLQKDALGEARRIAAEIAEELRRSLAADRSGGR
jgi:hypothetical protein